MKISTLTISSFILASFATLITVADVPEPADNELHVQLLEKLVESSSVRAPVMPKVDVTQAVYNYEAVIPPMCYTKTEGQYNPCYVCHQDEIPQHENKMNDGGLQLEYSFSDVGTKNHWKNLFEDRTQQVAAISDSEIDAWVKQDNYSGFAEKLQEIDFKGWIPDLKNLHLGKEAFDENGFARDGSHWVAFNYKPFPSTFWPTNGSTDDVMIRLPEAFRTNKQGEYSADVYKANLAILEAKLKDYDAISSLPFDESQVGKDLNDDGQLNTITQITILDSYVGAAEDRHIDTYMYPAMTEFLHTVRYLDVNEAGNIVPSTRMKEVRYLKKWKDVLKVSYAREYKEEEFAKELGNLPFFPVLGDWGLDNEFTWSVQGFIEDKNGDLRTLTYEENLFCMGCHSSIGATIDKTFSFPRKVDGAHGWGYINLKGMADAPNVGESKGEIATYLERVGGGGEFRSNPEMFERWFNADNTLNHSAVSMAADVYDLIVPSIERAKQLNKAYKVIVETQDFIYGRDATVTPPVNVYDNIDNETSPTLPEKYSYKWDIRLDWDAPEKAAVASKK